MKKIVEEFYDIDELFGELQQVCNFRLDDLFSDLRIENPMERWCEVHNLNPMLTKTKMDVDILIKWNQAEDQDNFMPPYLCYSNRIIDLVTDNINKYNVGIIDLNTFEDDINKSIGIDKWSIYWQKYLGRIYSVNQTFLELASKYSTNNKLKLFVDPDYYE